MVWLVVVAAVNTVASLFYYLRWMAPAFVGLPVAPAAAEGSVGTGARTAAGTAQEVRRAPAVVLHAAAALSVLLGVGAGLWLGVA
jgi:NADH-quinone oxidoreductase subunit N